MKKIGQSFLNAFTSDQIAQILDVLFDLLEEEKRKLLLSRVDQDIAETLAQLIESKKEKAAKVVSQSKRMEEWEGLWGEWQNIVDDVGNEEGKYIYQEHHWEEPEFDRCSLFEDLDKIAAKMWPLLEEIYEIGEEEKEIFAEALSEIQDGIDAYPEWKGWLDSLSKKGEEFIKQRSLVFILTQDLLKILGLQKEYPHLWNSLQSPYRNESFDQNRIKWLQKMGGEKHFPALLESWKQHISKMVPNPAHASARYENHAAWLAVTRELNPPVFQKILDEWKVVHKRRRNLWQDLKKIGIE